MTLLVGSSSFLKLALILTVVAVSVHLLLFRDGPTSFRLSDLGIVVTRRRREERVIKTIAAASGGGTGTTQGTGSSTPLDSTSRSSSLVPPRVYRTWDPHLKLPCYDQIMGSNKKVNKKYNFYHQSENNNRGFLYMRPPKCASSTVAGVNLRIARNEARRRQHFHSRGAPMCDLSFTHGAKHKGRRFQRRIYDQSYLWTIIREPTARHVSFFWFWGVSANGEDSSDAHMQDFLLSQQPNYYFLYLSPRYNVSKWQLGKSNTTMTRNDMWDEANYTLHAYDFIGITEKMDESLVVLMLLLNLPMADILYYSAKTSDNLYIDPSTKNQCIKLQPSRVSDSMRTFFATPTWQERIYSDELLYHAASQSLERTIDQLGRSIVQANVVKLQQAQALVVERCRGKIRMECEVEGEAPRKEFDCFHHDMGCGMDCLDQVATELDLW